MGGLGFTISYRGVCSLFQDDHDSAIADYTEAIRLDPKNVIYVLWRGNCFLEMGHWPKAIDDFTVFLNSGEILNASKLAKAHRSRGDAHFGLEDWDAAIADYTAAIAADKDPYSFYYRAYSWSRKGVPEKAIDDLTECIRIDATVPDSYARRAVELAKCGRFDEASADCEKHASLSPKGPFRHALRGIVATYRRDFKTASEELERATRENPGDVGNNAEVKLPLPASWLETGEQQVEQLCKDRPAVGAYLKDNHVLRAALVRKFAGEDHDSPIHWDPTPPSDGNGRCFVEGDPSRIQVALRRVARDGRVHDVTPEEQLRAVVFELNNVSNALRFRRLYRAAAEAAVSEREFIVQMGRLEGEASERTRAFYVRTILSSLESLQDPPATDPILWDASRWVDSDQPTDALGLLKRSDFRWKWYREFYRRHRFAYFLEKHEWERAQKQLDCIVDLFEHASEKVHEFMHAGYLSLEEGGDRFALFAFRRAARLARRHDLKVDLATCLSEIGTILERQGQLDEAIKNLDEVVLLQPNYADGYARRAEVAREAGRSPQQVLKDLDEALRLDPEHTIALRMRASLHHEQGEFAKAIADYQRVIELEPHDDEPYLALADCLIAGEGDHRNPARAIEMATKGCEKTTWSEPAALALLARCHAANKDFSAAAKYQDQAMHSAPEYDRQRYRQVLVEYRQAAEKTQPAVAP